MSGCIVASKAVLVVPFVSSEDLLVDSEVSFVLLEFPSVCLKQKFTTSKSLSLNSHYDSQA